MRAGSSVGMAVRWTVVLTILCVVVFCATTVLGQANLNVWEDVNGHLWAENSFYRWDVTHGSELTVKTALGEHNWRLPGYDSYRIELGDGGGNSSRPSYGVCYMSDLNIGARHDNGDGSTTVDLTGMFSTGHPLTMHLTFFEDYGYVKMNLTVGGVTSTPNPPGLFWRVSLVPGGTASSGDFYHYSGQSGESAFPYNGYTWIQNSGLGSLGSQEYVYITDYDKGSRQGFAMITTRDETADFITDINYGRAAIHDIHYYGGYASMSLHANSVVSPTVYWYFYETNPTTAYQPVEDLINSGTLSDDWLRELLE